ncbi:MAG: hypothetical protein ACJAVF_001175 [Paraglaciecola sp.]|jgi:hypothetical protein
MVKNGFLYFPNAKLHLNWIVYLCFLQKENAIQVRKEERGKRKEERGKRKEERGKRKEERGKRKEENNNLFHNLP